MGGDIDLTLRALVASLAVTPDPPSGTDLPPALAVLWTVMSLDRQKPGKIEARIKVLRDSNPEYGTLTLIREVAILMTPKALLLTELGHRGSKRAGMFLPLLERLIDELRGLPGATEGERALAWAAAARPSDWTSGAFRRLGLKGFQRLRRLLGANAVIPSKEHVAFVSAAVKRTVKAPEAAYLLERAAGRLGYDLRDVQAALWRQAGGGANGVKRGP